MIQFLAARGVSLAGFVHRMRSWRWARASRRSKKTSGSLQTELATAPGHPFYQPLNELLEAEAFDKFVVKQCAK
jgi:hypothetical protein